MLAMCEHILSVLLCFLPFLALLHFRSHLHLGVIRIMGHHYNLNRIFPAVTTKDFSNKKEKVSIREASKGQMHECGDLSYCLIGQSALEMGELITTTALFLEPKQEMKGKSSQFKNRSLLPHLITEQLRRVVRQSHKRDHLETFWAPDGDMPIIRVLHD